MKNTKKFLSLILVLAMLFTLSMTAMAALDTPYVTKVNDTVLSDSLWSKTVTVSTPQDVSFYVAVATNTIVNSEYVTNWSYFAYTPGSGETDEQIQAAANALVQSKITASVTRGADKLVSSTPTIAAQYLYTSGNTRYYAATITVKVSGSATAGTVRINVTGQNGTPTNTDCNFLIVVENNNTYTSATYVTVEAKDLIDDNYGGAYDVTVTAAGSNPGNLFYGDPASAQTYATAANTMDNLLSEGAIADVVAYSGYVDTVTMYDFNNDEVVRAPYMTQNYDYVGWVYGVFREIGGNMTYISDSAEISASVFELESGDYVVWAYGEYYSAMSFIEHYFDVNS